MSALPRRTFRRPFRYARHALPAFALLAALQRAQLRQAQLHVARRDAPALAATVENP